VTTLHDRAESRNKNQPLDTSKVAKLVRLLGSDKDGEILAAVPALRRTLGVAGIDLHGLADAITVGLEPRRATKPSPKPSKPAKQAKPPRKTPKPKWEPDEPDLLNWQSMCEYCTFYKSRLNDIDRTYIARVMSCETGFDLGRATPELMRRLRGIVAAVDASRNHQTSEKGRSDKDRTAN
jgi:hypothetical protein